MQGVPDVGLVCQDMARLAPGFVQCMKKVQLGSRGKALINGDVEAMRTK